MRLLDKNVTKVFTIEFTEYELELLCQILEHTARRISRRMKTLTVEITTLDRTTRVDYKVYCTELVRCPKCLGRKWRFAPQWPPWVKCYFCNGQGRMPATKEFRVVKGPCLGWNYRTYTRHSSTWSVRNYGGET